MSRILVVCQLLCRPITPDTQDQLHKLLKLFGPIQPKPRSAANVPPSAVSRNVLPGAVAQTKGAFDALPAVAMQPQVPIQPPVGLPPQVPMPTQVS